MEKLIRNNRLTETELLVDETMYSQANGFLGTRGTFIEGYGTDFEYNQTYLNAFYNNYDYFYEENLSGFPQEGQKFVNLIDGQRIDFLINGVPLNLETCVVLSLKREYDIEKGKTVRTIHYKTKEDYEFILIETKIASMEYKELIAVEVELISLNFTGKLKINSYLQKSHKKRVNNVDPRIYSGSTDDLLIYDMSSKTPSILCKTSRSNLYINTVMLHKQELDYFIETEKIVGKKTVDISPDKSFKIVKYIIYTSSLYHQEYLVECEKLVAKLANTTFDELALKQESYYAKFWKKQYIKVAGENDVEKLLNYNIYQLNSSGGDSSIHNIAAKGLSGEGYEGHYFWDTEIYMIPYFILTNPLKAKNLLMYRYNTIDSAKTEAQNLGYTKGIKYPWRTINGAETSPYYPAGSAQFHINSDIAYAIVKYYEATKDIDFMINYGFEMLIETARFLAEAVNKNEVYYHLNGVTGPDEYTTVVDDNYYTNIMLKHHFEYVSNFYDLFKSEISSAVDKLHVTDEEILKIKDIAKNIHLPFDKTLNIFAQDAGFLKKEKLDLSSIPEDMYPLLMNYHPLYLYKHQVLKQADTMLSMMLLDFEDESILKDSFDYYEPITTHDSSLSKCIYSILAFKLKKYDMACEYFNKVLKTDFLNTHKNTNHGLHVANLGGSYLAFIYGVVGLRIKPDYIKINPVVTKKIKGYEVNIEYQGVLINIEVDDKVTVSSTGKVSLEVYSKRIELDGSYQIALKN